VRRGTARFHDRVDEAILTPTLGPVPSTTASRAGAWGGAGSGPGSTGRRSEPGRPSRRDDRRSEAELREARHRATKDLKKAVRDAERAWEKAEQVVTELERQLADPEIYGDHSRIADLAARHGQARKEALAAMEVWESATEKLAAAEATQS